MSAVFLGIMYGLLIMLQACMLCLAVVGIVATRKAFKEASKLRPDVGFMADPLGLFRNAGASRPSDRSVHK